MSISYFNLCMILGMHTLTFTTQGEIKHFFTSTQNIFYVHNVLFNIVVCVHYSSKYISLETMFKSLPVSLRVERQCCTQLLYTAHNHIIRIYCINCVKQLNGCV